ncbi:hypothetical protein BO85DRAFT_480976 [Aspergillus piperis CBS 112811]|uniref:Uncharacterized protein n=2 Tax=Aspergillus subgen. Circumdati TaxID=2720871 RepID=A0A8G1QX64_9EURO|nr:hypothetical protein BO85DRAFT_480976 [Aspergillus piperis CBS 112811]XP_025568981.1 hypothetical protein BO88DRAFT_431587 [Aspergillus vadensis CBS 113365]PYH75187.1 hypothetical protein BO88DRAFT_431587 [Aspergillus vadensis CBS 113365]RAH53805.1 hypothetical protein BO85DRAFT_480976 [Aspergillus piperis CBS 112811]
MSGARSESVHSRPTNSAYDGFFSLPVELRHTIYREVLAVQHPLFLFQDPGCPIETFTPERPHQWLALLYTNRKVSMEARAVLYGANEFVLEDVSKCQGSLLDSFLTCIGPVNAGFLSRLRVNFPVIESIDDISGDIRLREDGLQSLRLLQDKCTNLKILETLVYGQVSRLITEKEISNHSFRSVLLSINTQFRAIASLNKIIVKFCSGSPASSTTEFMKQLGWIVLLGNR